MSTDAYGYEPPVAQGLYFKFEDKFQHKLRIASDPAIYLSSFNGQAPSEKYAWVVWNVDAEKAQVLQVPVTVYRAIRALAKDPEYGDPKQYGLKITRTGQKLETKYDVVPSPSKIPLSEVHKNAEAECAKIDLLDALKKGQGNSDVEWLTAETKRETIAPPANVETAGPSPEDEVGPDGEW